MTCTAMTLAPDVSKACGTRQRWTNIEAYQWQPESDNRAMFGIGDYPCAFIDVSDSVLGIFCVEFFREKLLD